MKEDVRKLWELCFGDSGAFVDLYFDKRYRDDINLAIVENGQVISALQMLPYMMTYYDRQLSVSYISGASTHPAFRSKGVMRKLLEQSHLKMYENGVLVSALIPADGWLFGYYERRGYTPAFYNSCKTVDAANLECGSGLQIEEAFAGQENIYSYFDRKMSERNCCIQHSQDDFHVILSDLHIGGGKMFAAHIGRQVAGLLFCLPSQGVLSVPEFVADSETVLHSLFKTASVQMGFDRLELCCPSVQGTQPKGMARIIRADDVMQLYARSHPSVSVIIEVSDENLPKNNGIYILENGVSRRVGSLEGAVPMQMNIGQLTQFFLKGESTCMSLMLD